MEFKFKLILFVLFNLVNNVVANKLTEMEKITLSSQMENNKLNIAKFSEKIEASINELVEMLKKEHLKVDRLKKFIAAHPDLDNGVAQSLNLVLTKSKFTDTKVTELLNRLDSSKKMLNAASDASIKCLQMLVNYTDDVPNGEEIKSVCSESQAGLINAVQIFNNEQTFNNEIVQAQKLIMESSSTLENVQSVIDNFIQKNGMSSTAGLNDAAKTVPTTSDSSPVRVLSTPTTPPVPPETTPFPTGITPTSSSASKLPTVNSTSIDTTGTPSLPLDGVSTVVTETGKPSINPAAVPAAPVANEIAKAAQLNSNPLSPQLYDIGGGNEREYTEEEYAILLERIRKSIEAQKVLVERNKQDLAKFEELLQSVNKSKETLSGGISRIPRIAVDYDHTILQFDKLSENSDDIEKAIVEHKNKITEDLNLLTQLSQQSEVCVQNLLVKSKNVYTKCLAVFNYWNDNSQRLQTPQNDQALFTRAEIINKSMTDMINTLKSSGMFINKDVSDEDGTGKSVTQNPNEEYVTELNGNKPLTQIEDVIQMANDANTVLNEILKELTRSETVFNNNYQLIQEAQTEIDALSKKPEFSNPVHKPFLDSTMQILKSAQILPANAETFKKTVATDREQAKEIENELTVCISSLSNMNELSDDKEQVMEKCREAASNVNKLNDSIKGDVFQNLISLVESTAKVLSQRAISMKTLVKNEAPLAEPSINEISNDAKIGPEADTKPGFELRPVKDAGFNNLRKTIFNESAFNNPFNSSCKIWSLFFMLPMLALILV